MQETEISTLGEFGLISHLTRELKSVNSSTLLGVGDDCAILDAGGGMVKLLTTDLLLEGIHFDLTYTPLKHLGYKAVAVNLSDVCAMNGTPKQITVSLGISKRFTVEHITELYSGILAACERYSVDLVGGDTSASVTGLLISVTCVGEALADEVVRRSGAHATDLLMVSGDLGAAYMGLQLLERERAASAGQPEGFQPDFAGKEYLLQRQLRPEARTDVLKELKEIGVRPTSMIDVSDGLSSEVLHLCHESKVGARVYEERIPIDYQTAIMAEELNMNLVTAAMNGGEDYELLFTVPLTEHDKVQQMSTARLIGHITKPELGANLVTRDGNEMQLKAQGWNAFKQ